jgi:hypothetical protein
LRDSRDLRRNRLRHRHAQRNRGQIDKILEPITILVLGVVVGTIIYAIYGPIFGLGKVILPDTTKPKPQPVPALSSPE